MYVITRRCCLAWLRKKRLWTQSHEQMEQVDNEQLEETVYSEYVAAEKEKATVENQREIVKKLLEKLQESERTVVTLHYFGEMSCAEIGEFLGVSANTIKSRLRRARQSLKKHEPIIKEALENFKITPSLTENIMCEISQTQPILPSRNKPLVPWLITATSVVVVMLMLGFGYNKTFARFQQPNSPSIPTKESPVEGTVENYPQWHLPKQAKMRLGKGGMESIQFSPDGKHLVVGSRIGVWRYDVKTGEEISLIQNMRGVVVYSPDGRFMASGEGDPLSSVGGSRFERSVVLWDTGKKSEVKIQEALPSASVMRFSNDSKTLVFLSKSRDAIYRIDVETGNIKTTKMAERPGILHLEKYALTENKIAIGSRKGRIEVWDTITGTKLSTLREIPKKVILPNNLLTTNHTLTLKFSHDGRKLATGIMDTTVQLWDASTREVLRVFQKPIEGNIWGVPWENPEDVIKNPMKNEYNSIPAALALSPDGILLACGSEDSTIKLWNTVTSELWAIFTGHLSDVGMLVFSPDGNTLASASDDGTVRFWDIKLRKAINTQITGHMSIRTASMLKDSYRLVSVLDPGIISVWDLKNSLKTTSISKFTLEGPEFRSMYRSLALSSNGTKLLNVGIQSNPFKPNYKSDVLRLTDVNTGRELATFPPISGRKTSPDGKILAGREENKIQLFKIETDEIREIITSDHFEDSDVQKPKINTLAFSSDGEKIVSGTKSGHVQLWNVETGKELSSFFEEWQPSDNSERESILHFAFSSDSSLIAVGSGKRIRLIESAKQAHFTEIVYTDREDGETFIFSPDDKVLIVGYSGGKIRFWDVATGDLLTTLEGHPVSVDDLSFSYDNKTLMSVGGDTILFWDWKKILKKTLENGSEHKSEVNLLTEEKSTDTVLQFIEHSLHPAKTSDRVLTKVEVYLANEWYEASLEEFTKYLTGINDDGDEKFTTSPNFQRELFTKIGKAGKNIQDKEGFVEMVRKLIESIPDSLSIQLNGHLVLAKFYHHHGMFDRMDEHMQKIDSLTANLQTENFRLRLNIYLSLVNYYHDIELSEKRAEDIQKINDMIAELDPNKLDNLKLQLEANFGLADYYLEHGMPEKAAEHIQKTGFVTEDAWMVLGPFDNDDGSGYNTPYIPETITEIDSKIRYDGQNEAVSWKRFTDAKLDGYIYLPKKNLKRKVTYTFATVTSPDTRDVEFRFDSEDQGKLWLNGKEEFSHTKTFPMRIDTYTFPVTLNQGKNSILVKVCLEERRCAFILRITDKNGHAFEDLVINRVTQ